MVGLDSTAVPLRPGPASPVVESFDEVAYVCKPDDTYAKISLRYYGTEEYGAALQKFNHRHARASEAMRRDGAILPGETLFIPPANVLERRHADAIPKKPAAGGAVKPASFNAPGTLPAAGAPQEYVTGGNETLSTMVRRIYGSTDRLPDVLKLNPALRESDPVPAGTRVLLPAGAPVRKGP
jgi:hypothetical protein